VESGDRWTGSSISSGSSSRSTKVLLVGSSFNLQQQQPQRDPHLRPLVLGNLKCPTTAAVCSSNSCIISIHCSCHLQLQSHLLCPALPICHHHHHLLLLQLLSEEVQRVAMNLLLHLPGVGAMWNMNLPSLKCNGQQLHRSSSSNKDLLLVAVSCQQKDLNTHSSRLVALIINSLQIWRNQHQWVE